MKSSILTIFKQEFEAQTTDDLGHDIGYARYWFSHIVILLLTIGLIMFIPKGFNELFTNTLVSFFSILTGVFIAALIFGIELIFKRIPKESTRAYQIFYRKENEDTEHTVYMQIQNNMPPKNIDKEFQIKSINYLKRIVSVISKTILIAVFALFALLLYVYSPDFYGINVQDYCLTAFSLESFLTFLHVTAVLFIRIFIVYFTLLALMNSVSILASINKYVSVVQTFLSQSEN